MGDGWGWKEGTVGFESGQHVREELVIVRFGNTNQVARLDTGLFKHPRNQLQCALTGGFAAQHRMQAQEFVELMLVVRIRLVESDSALARY